MIFLQTIFIFVQLLIFAVNGANLEQVSSFGNFLHKNVNYLYIKKNILLQHQETQ